MNVMEQLKPILKSIDEAMEVIEQAPATARLALLAYLQLITLRVENKAMKEYKNNEVTKADVEFLMFAMQTKAQCLCERNDDEENKN